MSSCPLPTKDQTELCTDAQGLSSKALAKMKMIILQMDSKSFLLIVLSAKDIKIELNNIPINKSGKLITSTEFIAYDKFMLWLPD